MDKKVHKTFVFESSEDEPIVEDSVRKPKKHYDKKVHKTFVFESSEDEPIVEDSVRKPKKHYEKKMHKTLVFESSEDEPTVEDSVKKPKKHYVDLTKKAKSMHKEIKNFLKNYKDSCSKQLPRANDVHLIPFLVTSNDDDPSSQYQIDELANFLCANYPRLQDLSSQDVSSLLHNTVQFIINYSQEEKKMNKKFVFESSKDEPIVEGSVRKPKKHYDTDKKLHRIFVFESSEEEPTCEESIKKQKKHYEIIDDEQDLEKETADKGEEQESNRSEIMDEQEIETDYTCIKDEEQKSNRSERTTVECMLCDKEFSSRNDLKNHIMKDHSCISEDVLRKHNMHFEVSLTKKRRKISVLEDDDGETKMKKRKNGINPQQISLGSGLQGESGKEKYTFERNGEYSQSMVTDSDEKVEEVVESERRGFTFEESDETEDSQDQDYLDDETESLSGQSSSDDTGGSDINKSQSSTSSQEEGRKSFEKRLGIPEDKISYLVYPGKILADIMLPCLCDSNCYVKLSEMKDMMPKIQSIRLGLWSLIQGPTRQNRLIELMRSSRVYVEEKKLYQHCFEGILFCIKKWIKILGISRSTYYRSLSDINNGIVNKERVPKLSHRNTRGLEAAGFLEMAIQNYADFSPVLVKRILPPVVTKKYLWEEYKEEKSKQKDAIIVSEHYFYKLFHLYFKDVSFAKQKHINPCSICLLAVRNLHVCRDPGAKAALKSDLKEHLDRQRKERLHYYSKREKAIKSPQQCLSLIIDGMDQSKTGVPHFRGWSRPKEAQQYLKTHITGVVVHGQTDMFFVDINEYPHDPNMTCTCLVNALIKHARDRCLPPTIYLQCDNCGRENKNKYLFGFLSYLCLKGYVKEIFLSFLMKGHTHEDIDQRFSKISHHLRKVDALTVSSLTTEIGKSFSAPIHVEQIGTIWDVRAWISGSLNNIVNHSFAHQFWFYSDTPDHIVLKARLWSTDEWYPSVDEDPIELLLYNQDDKQCCPTGEPGTVEPNFEKLELNNFKQIVTKMKNHLNYREREWWEDFFLNPHKGSIKKTRWPLSALKPVYKITEIPPTVRLQTVIEDEIETERNRPKIKTKKRICKE